MTAKKTMESEYGKRPDWEVEELARRTTTIKEKRIVDTRMDGLEVDVMAMEERVTDLEESVKDDSGLDGRVVALEDRVQVLEALIQSVVEALSGKAPKKARKTRAKRTYTDEERAEIRARLVAGKKKKAEERARLAEEAGEEDE